MADHWNRHQAIKKLTGAGFKKSKIKSEHGYIYEKGNIRVQIPNKHSKELTQGEISDIRKAIKKAGGK